MVNKQIVIDHLKIINTSEFVFQQQMKSLLEAFESCERSFSMQKQMELLQTAFQSIDSSYSSSLINMESIIRSSVFQMQDQISRFSLTTNSVFSKLSKDILSVNIFNVDLLTKSFSQVNFNIFDTLQSLSSIIEDKNIYFSSLFPSFTSILTPNYFGNNIIGELEIESGIETENENQINKAIIEIRKLSLMKVFSLKSLKRNAFNYISLFFAIYTYIQTNISSSDLKADISRKIEASRTEIISEFHSEIGKLNKLDKKFVVERDLNLRLGPSSKAKIICILSKYSLVDIIESKNEWVKIMYLDYSSGELLTGWLYKKYLTNGRILSK